MRILIVLLLLTPVLEAKLWFLPATERRVSNLEVELNSKDQKILELINKSNQIQGLNNEALRALGVDTTRIDILTDLTSEDIARLTKEVREKGREYRQNQRQLSSGGNIVATLFKAATSGDPLTLGGIGLTLLTTFLGGKKIRDKSIEAEEAKKDSNTSKMKALELAMLSPQEATEKLKRDTHFPEVV